MATTKRCPFCRASMIEHGYGLDVHLVEVLNTLHRCEGPLHYDDERISRKEMTRWSWLKYLGLVDNVARGMWDITPTGVAFLRDEAAVPPFAWVFRDEVVERAGEPITAAEVTRVRWHQGDREHQYSERDISGAISDSALIAELHSRGYYVMDVRTTAASA